MTPFDEVGLAEGRVSFGAIERTINLCFVPEVRVGDYVVVHVGFAISIIDEAEALRTQALLRHMGAFQEELGPGEPP